VWFSGAKFGHAILEEAVLEQTFLLVLLSDFWLTVFLKWPAWIRHLNRAEGSEVLCCQRLFAFLPV